MPSLRPTSFPGPALDYGVAPPGYRLPATTRLGPVRLQVADLARSVAYYERVVGLRVLTRSERTATLGPQSEARPIVELNERPGRVEAGSDSITSPFCFPIARLWAGSSRNSRRRASTRGCRITW